MRKESGEGKEKFFFFFFVCRKVIAPADVLLLVRRNPRIHDAIKANAGEPAPKKAKKKGAAAATSAADAAE